MSYGFKPITGGIILACAAAAFAQGWHEASPAQPEPPSWEEQRQAWMQVIVSTPIWKHYMDQMTGRGWTPEQARWEMVRFYGIDLTSEDPQYWRGQARRFMGMSNYYWPGTYDMSLV